LSRYLGVQRAGIAPWRGLWGVIRMPVPNIVIGQKVETGKIARARELRRSMTAAEALLWQ
jgi:hypothetical protein